jgi:lanosterol synthase
MALREIQHRYPDLLRHRIQRAIESARNFIISAQNACGTWDAAWGVHYIYATMFGVRGLIAAGVAPADERIQKARRWLLAHQRPDGGWGEHHASRTMGRYVDAHAGLSVQTAWALITLVDAREPDGEALARAADFLESTQLDSGEWSDGQFVGLFFETALLNYRLYRQYFPVMALALFRRSLTAHEQPERTHASTAPSSRP